MKPKGKIFAHIDWLVLVLYGSLVIFGWLNIHAVSYQQGLHQSAFDLSRSAGKQFLWAITCVPLFGLTLFFETKFYQSLAYVLYGLSLCLLLGTLVLGVNISGHSAWFQWQGVQLQPAEFAKLTCALAIAKYLDDSKALLTRLKPQLISLSIVLLPVGLIILQGDLGSCLVFGAFVLVLYREGLPPWLILLGLLAIAIIVLTLLIPRPYLLTGMLSLALAIIGASKKTTKRLLLILLMTLSTVTLSESFRWFVGNVLKPHQQNRIKALVDPQADPLGIGWNVTQSKIAIGSGGIWGKGYLQGTQTKYGFVPEQSTDFIFCTIGEEHGWAGALLVISIFWALMARVLYLAERQRLRFTRAYGYAVASILFVHFMINVGMTIGLMPVIGIPLPFISYGGSSLWAFSLMLFILLKFDADRKNHLVGRNVSKR